MLPIQKAVRDFVKGEFDKSLIAEMEANHQYPEKIWKKAAEPGFIGIHFPEAYSGQGMGVMENILVAEALCAGDSTVGACLILADFASEIILHFGSEEQKRTWLPKVAEGEVLSCGAFTEPDHGSDITSLNTAAVKEADAWVINGSKIFITNGGPLAGFYSVLCQTDATANPGYRGMSLILVEADRTGVSTSDVGAKMGIRMMHTAEVTFKDVRVPLKNLIGKENRGFYQVLEFFDESRILIAAQALGTAQGAFDRALAYVKSREQFDRKIAQFQVTQHKLADMATKIEMARLLVYKAAGHHRHGRHPRLPAQGGSRGDFQGHRSGGGHPSVCRTDHSHRHVEVAVVPVPDDKWGEVPKAFVVPKPGSNPTAAGIIDFCKANLARFKAPKTVEFGPLPKTATGKIQKFKLRDKEWQGRQRRVN